MANTQRNSKYSDSKYKTIGFIRVKENSKTGEPFYTVSFDGIDIKRAILRMDSAKLKAVRADKAQLGVTVIGTIVVPKEDTYTTTTKPAAFTPRATNTFTAKPTTPTAAQTLAADDDVEF